jgi:hypothetical protein
VADPCIEPTQPGRLTVHRIGGPATDSLGPVIDDDLLLTAVHDNGIRRLHTAYADVVNRRAWSELEALFLEEAVVTVDTRGGDALVFEGGAGIGDFIGGSVAQFSFFEFVVLNAYIVFPDGPGAGSAVGRMYICEHRQAISNGRWTNAFGLYHDRFQWDAGGWRYAHRTYHSLARNAPDLDVFPFPSPEPVEVPGPGSQR